MFWKDKLQKVFGNRLKLNYSLKEKSSLKTGGECECFLEVQSEQEIIDLLKLAKQKGFKVNILGRGSNVLIFDGFIPGVVIQAYSHQNDFEVKEEEITFNSSIYLPRSIQIAQTQELIGLEFAAGIPGTIGGAVKMNAGTKLGEIKDVLSNVTILSHRGVFIKTKKDLLLSYRYSNINDDFFIHKVKLKLKKGSSKELEEAKINLKKYLSYRNSTQPLNKPNIGSTFINPNGHHAAKLIDFCDLKGFRMGGIQVSTLHANFIINDGSGTSAEAMGLIKHIIKTVKKKTGIILTPEIKMFGFN